MKEIITRHLWIKMGPCQSVRLRFSHSASKINQGGIFFEDANTGAEGGQPFFFLYPQLFNEVCDGYLVHSLLSLSL